MTMRDTYISRLEADLEELMLHRRLSEMDGTDSRAAVLLAKERFLRECLKRARDAPDSAWEEVRKELQNAWKDLKSALADGESGGR